MRCRFLDMRSYQCTVLTITILHKCSSGQGKHWVLSLLSARGSSPCSRPPACRPHCASTQLWPSQGSPRNLPSWLRFQVRLNAVPVEICVKWTVCHLSASRVCLFWGFFAAHMQSTPGRLTLHAMSVVPANIELWHIFKTLPQSFLTVYAAY